MSVPSALIVLERFVVPTMFLHILPPPGGLLVPLFPALTALPFVTVLPRAEPSQPGGVGPKQRV